VQADESCILLSRSVGSCAKYGLSPINDHATDEEKVEDVESSKEACDSLQKAYGGCREG